MSERLRKQAKDVLALMRREKTPRAAVDLREMLDASEIVEEHERATRQEKVRPMIVRRRQNAASYDPELIDEVLRLREKGMSRAAIARHLQANRFPDATEKVVRTILARGR